MDLKVALALEQLVKSPSVVSFNACVNEVFNLGQSECAGSEENVKTSD